MTYPSPTTPQIPLNELDAVNLMLATIGESPVASLTPPLPADATVAQTTLREILFEVLSQGWYFNTYPNYLITADGSGFLTLPATALRVYSDPSIATSLNLVQKGTKFWDRKNQTYVFAAGTQIYCEVVEMLDYIDLPPHARRYVAVRAARIFAERVQGSQSNHQMSAQQELAAVALMKQAEQDQARRTMFDNADVYRVVDRRI